MTTEGTTAGTRETFWSRRRRAVRAEAEAAATSIANAQAAAARAEVERAQATRSDGEILKDLGLQDPDLMQMGDDFAAFMNSAVPERLRRRALRTLWRSNPVLANLDGLIDYGEDFTDAAMVVPNMKSAYQVGRGMLRHVEALAEAAEAEARTDPDVANQGCAEPGRDQEDPANKPDTDATTQVAAPSEPTRIAAVSTDALALEVPARPRHMRFTFVD